MCLVAACSVWARLAGIASAQPLPTHQPQGWDQDLRLAETSDSNADPKIVEVSLTARVAEVEVAPGERVRAWTYNGSIPGPLIRARVGDRVIVHFVNELPQPTTVHWHGVRVPIEMDTDGQSEFQVNGVPSWKARPFLAALGQKQIWTVKNESKFAHPFHLHGFFFQPLDERLQPIRPMAWKDTINVPIDGTVRFLVTFDERPGTWMFHCHILDHADGGLMGHVHVGSTPPASHHRR